MSALLDKLLDPARAAAVAAGERAQAGPLSYAGDKEVIRALRAELEALRVQGCVPQDGGAIATLTLGGASVLVEYEYLPAQQPIYDADHPGVGPGHDAELNLLNVFINGYWCDVEDVIPDAVAERWRVELLERVGDAS